MMAALPPPRLIPVIPPPRMVPVPQSDIVTEYRYSTIPVGVISIIRHVTPIIVIRRYILRDDVIRRTGKSSSGRTQVCLDLFSVNPTVIDELRPVIRCPHAGDVQLVTQIGASDHVVGVSRATPDSKTVVRLVHSDNSGNATYRLGTIR